MNVGDLRRAMQGLEDWREVRLRRTGGEAFLAIDNAHQCPGEPIDRCLMLVVRLPAATQLEMLNELDKALPT